MDTDGSNSIEMSEFFAATLGRHRLLREEILHAAFAYIDKDCSGFITVDELQSVCAEYGIESHHIADMMAEVDINNVSEGVAVHPYGSKDGVGFITMDKVQIQGALKSVGRVWNRVAPHHRYDGRGGDLQCEWCMAWCNSIS